MSKKGITPVIAMILLILIVVALGGVFAAWTTRTWQGVQEKGGEQVEQVTGQMQKSAAIDNIDCAKENIYVKNTGSANITEDEFGIYIGDTLYQNSTNVDIDSTILQSNKIATINVTDANRGSEINKTVKISVGAGIQDTNDKCE